MAPVIPARVGDYTPGPVAGLILVRVAEPTLAQVEGHTAGPEEAHIPAPVEGHTLARAVVLIPAQGAEPTPGRAVVLTAGQEVHVPMPPAPKTMTHGTGPRRTAGDLAPQTGSIPR